MIRENECPTCGSEGLQDDHKEGCARIDTCGQFGPPWSNPPWHPQLELPSRMDPKVSHLSPDEWRKRYADPWSAQLRSHMIEVEHTFKERTE